MPAAPHLPLPGTKLVPGLSRLIARAMHATPTGVDRVKRVAR